MTPSSSDAILTLEPLIEAVRSEVERAGWELSGLQKTTSHQFEGRWDGESTRSAYLFFHLPLGPEYVSVDVYLDETSRGLAGNLALVADLVPLGEMGDAEAALRALATPSRDHLDERHRRPVTLRLRISDASDRLEGAETEVRFKVRIARRTIAAGADSVTAFASEVMQAFGRILDSDELARLAPRED